jgi:hypothetical protein
VPGSHRSPGRTSAQTPRGNHALHQGWGSVLVPLELLIQGTANSIEDVKAHEIAQRERTHGVTATEFHAFVDVLPAGETILVHSYCGHKIGDQQKVDDEAGTVLRLDGLLAESFGEHVGLLDRLVAGVKSAHDHHQAYHGHGGRRVQPDHTVRGAYGTR